MAIRVRAHAVPQVVVQPLSSVVSRPLRAHRQAVMSRARIRFLQVAQRRVLTVFWARPVLDRQVDLRVHPQVGAQ